MGALLDFRLKWEYQGKTGEIKAGSESLFHRAFLKLREGLLDWSPAFEVIADDILEPFVEEQFESEGKRAGLTWQELAPETIERRGSAHPILTAEGGLKISFMKGAAQHEQTITPRKLVWGSRVPYALFHQTGTGKGFQRERVATGKGTGRGMAMRKILSFTEPLKQRMARSITGRIDQVARAIGFKTWGRAERMGPGEARRIGYIALGLRP